VPLPGAASGPRHDLAVVGSDEELHALAAAHLREGLDAGDVVQAVLPRAVLESLAPTLDGAELVAVDEVCRQREPDTIVQLHRQLRGARPRRLRLLSRVTGARMRAWDEISRCEAVTNIAFAEDPISVLCVYDRRETPDDALERALRTHPRLHTADGGEPNPSYQDPHAFLASLPVPEEPLQRTAPVLALDAATSLPDLRHRLERALRGRAGDREVEADFHLAASEIAANAFRHGRPPVSARLWASADRLVCAISDAGTSYADPAAGYQPAHGEDLGRGGMGLWLARKLCDHVDLIRGPGGLTVRLVTALR
jgi:anti-sigma regulatory factor (Ser/Thr protein kinase)